MIWSKHQVILDELGLYKSLYPSIILENNIATNTQLGRIIIDKPVYEGENAYNNPKYSRGGEFIENLVTDNIIEFCKRWLHLAGFKDLIKDMHEYFVNKYICYSSYGQYDRYYLDDENQIKTVPIKDYTDRKLQVVKFSNEKIRPLRFLTKRK